MTASTHASKSSPLVLLVDDEPDLLLLLRIELEYAGFTVMTAANGCEAIAAMEKKTPDVILSDIRMPQGDGLFLLDHVMKERKGHPPVVFITGFADVDEATALERGAVGYLHKPVDIHTVVELLRRVASAAKRRRLDGLNGRDHESRAPAAE